jgi:lipopolysaccharide export system protein LptA
MIRAILAALLLGTTAAAAGEANPAATLGVDTGQPIAVNADSFTADLKAETGTYIGNVIVVQGDVKLRADNVTVAAPGGKATRLEARGNVVVDSPSGQARGSTAVYDVPAEVIRLAGPVVLTKDQNVMRGNALTVNVQTGQAQLSGGVAAGGQRGSGRVQGLFVPQQPAQQPTNP